MSLLLSVGSFVLSPLLQSCIYPCFLVWHGIRAMRVQRRPSWKGGEGRLLVCMHMRVRGVLGCGVSVSLDLAVSLCMGCGGDGGDEKGGCVTCCLVIGQ